MRDAVGRRVMSVENRKKIIILPLSLFFSIEIEPASMFDLQKFWLGSFEFRSRMLMLSL